MTVCSNVGLTHHTMNFWWGCERISTECEHCYIDRIIRRTGNEPFGGPVRAKDWTKPEKWNRRASERQVRYRVLTCAICDFFHPGADAWRSEAWRLIRHCINLDWLILTKRPRFILDRLPKDWGPGYPNVWLGVTCGTSTSFICVELLRMTL